jgi:hypothetical protein
MSLCDRCGASARAHVVNPEPAIRETHERTTTIPPAPIEDRLCGACDTQGLEVPAVVLNPRGWPRCAYHHAVELAALRRGEDPVAAAAKPPAPVAWFPEDDVTMKAWLRGLDPGQLNRLRAAVKWEQLRRGYTAPGGADQFHGPNW